MSECIFCQIVTHTIPTTIILENEDVMVFPDQAPQAPHHYLIIPKIHIPTLNDIGPAQQAIAGKLLLAAQQVAKQLDIADDGYRLVMNCNRYGGQTVYHLHAHLLGGELLAHQFA